MTEQERAVIEAARAWNRVSTPDDAEDAREALMDAVGALEESLKPNQPTGFIVDRPWGEIPAGWFVKAPNGQWYEVIGTAFRDARQWVTTRLPGGTDYTGSRDPAAKVPTRRGSLHPEADAALDALGGAFTVDVLDDPPW